jgi:uncharacterized membrane protein YgcG
MMLGSTGDSKKPAMKKLWRFGWKSQAAIGVLALRDEVDGQPFNARADAGGTIRRRSETNDILTRYMMMKIERASGKVFRYAFYIVAAMLAFVLASLNVKSETGLHQLLGGGVTIGDTAYADVPAGSAAGTSGGGTAGSSTTGGGTSGGTGGGG